eukprot:COSAG02_NODE_2482_length_8724_cov_136.350609_9_plen_173_part_00
MPVLHTAVCVICTINYSAAPVGTHARTPRRAVPARARGITSVSLERCNICPSAQVEENFIMRATVLVIARHEQTKTRVFPSLICVRFYIQIGRVLGEGGVNQNGTSAPNNDAAESIKYLRAPRFNPTSFPHLKLLLQPASSRSGFTSSLLVVDAVFAANEKVERYRGRQSSS